MFYNVVLSRNTGRLAPHAHHPALVAPVPVEPSRAATAYGVLVIGAWGGWRGVEGDGLSIGEATLGLMLSGLHPWLAGHSTEQLCAGAVTQPHRRPQEPIPLHAAPGVRRSLNDAESSVPHQPRQRCPPSPLATYTIWLLHPASVTQTPLYQNPATLVGLCTASVQAYDHIRHRISSPLIGIDCWAAEGRGWRGYSTARRETLSAFWKCNSVVPVLGTPPPSLPTPCFSQARRGEDRRGASGVCRTARALARPRGAQPLAPNARWRSRTWRGEARRVGAGGAA
jgi:hypothetical protein